jgi:hypothetical protein
VHSETDGPVAIVTLDRPEAANAGRPPHADELTAAFRRFDTDDALAVAEPYGHRRPVLRRADLKAMHEQSAPRAGRVATHADAPIGPTRILLGKPAIAAVEGHERLECSLSHRGTCGRRGSPSPVLPSAEAVAQTSRGGEISNVVPSCPGVAGRPQVRTVGTEPAQSRSLHTSSPALSGGDGDLREVVGRRLPPPLEK